MNNTYLKKIIMLLYMMMISGWVGAKPDAPGLVITVEGQKVTAFWNPVIGAEDYTFFYAPFPNLTPISSFSMDGQTDISAVLEVGTSFAVAVKAINQTEESDFSNIEFFTVESSDPEDVNASVSKIISEIATNVILANYDDFAIQAENLTDALLAFQVSPTDENLQKVQSAWRDARRTWEQTEAFLFGPVDTQGIDPAVDSWPVNRTDLDAVLGSSNTLNVPFVTALDDTLHGFHTIEYLIFGADNMKQAADLTSRELEYLVSTTNILFGHVNDLANAWRASEGNFVNEFSTAGNGSQTYPSETAALQELVNGMIGIVDEVGNGKIADPFSQNNPELVESQFSFNSLLDFENNIRGVENIYLGRYLQQDGAGLNDLVARNDPQLDSRIRQHFDDVINAIQAIPFPFRDSISDPQANEIINSAQEQLGELQNLLESELAPNILTYQ